MLEAQPTLEEVVLLDEVGTPIGTADKYRIHTKDTPLHSAFSIFLFNRSGQMLVQQRAWTKQTWPGVWSNACCGHPLPAEPLEAAAHRRLSNELGLYGVKLMLALPSFRYRAEYLGIVENEICPVFIGIGDLDPIPNPDEVAACNWVDWNAFAAAASQPRNTRFENFSPWSLLEASELVKTSLVAKLFESHRTASRAQSAATRLR